MQYISQASSRDSPLVWRNNRFVKNTPLKSKVAIVTFASGSYFEISKKLVESAKRYNPDVSVFVFNDYGQIGCPPHETDPYAFKVYAIEHIRNKGFDVVIWCDSCIRVARSINPFINSIESCGVYLQADGWKTGEWANDRSLAYFGVTRDEAMNISAIYACIMGFDFRHQRTNDFFRLWKKSCEDGMFRGKWKNIDHSESSDDRCTGHRHDQTCAELTSYKLGIPQSPMVLFPGKPDEPMRFFTTWNNP